MFANPWALLLLLLAAPIAWLYRRLSAAPSNVTGSGDIWRQVLAEQRARAWWLPRRRAASLAAQLLILTLAVLALAQPRLTPPRTIILILDTSGSMNATDVSPSRFELARRHALRFVDSLSAGDRLAVLAAGAPVRVVCAPSLDQRQLREALETVEVGTGPTLVAHAVAVARQMLEGEPAGRIAILSDACFSEAAALAAADDIDLLTVGGQAANVAVRRVAARRDPIEPETARVLIELVGHPAEVAEVIPLEMRLDGILQESAAEPSDPGGRLARIVAATDAASGTFSVLAPSDDVLQADNRRDAQIPPAELLTVGSVGPLGGALNVALRADRRVRYLEAGGMPSAGTDGLAGAAGTILIVRGDVPTTLPPGPMLVVAPAAGCDLFEIEGTIARAVIGEQDITSSIVAGLDLEGIALSDVARLKLPTRAARDLRIVAASAEGEPLLVAFDRAEGRVVVLLGDTDASELSHHAEFPRLLSQVLQWLAEMEERSEPEHDGRERDIFSAGESDLRVPAKVGTPADSWRMPASRPPAWLLLGALSITLLLVEWRLYHRRWIS